MSRTLTRRELLARGTTLLLLVPVAACSSSYGGGSPAYSTPDGGGGSACNGIDATSTVNESHEHMVCVPTTDLTNPPAAGATYTTTNVSGHTHTVTLAQQQLSSIESGTPVTVLTSSAVDPVDGKAHTHQFTIMMA